MAFWGHISVTKILWACTKITSLSRQTVSSFSWAADQDCDSLLGFHPLDRERDHVELLCFFLRMSLDTSASSGFYSLCNQEHELHSNIPIKYLWSRPPLTWILLCARGNDPKALRNLFENISSVVFPLRHLWKLWNTKYNDYNSMHGRSFIIYKTAYSSSVFLSKDCQNMQTHTSVDTVIWFLKNKLCA